MSRGIICDICKKQIDVSKEFIKCEIDTMINNDKVARSDYLDFHLSCYEEKIKFGCIKLKEENDA